MRGFHMTVRDYRKEMFACIIGAFKRGPHYVDVPTHDGTVFRCKPSVEGGVILKIGRSRKQYTHLTMDEWVEWAGEQVPPDTKTA